MRLFTPLKVLAILVAVCAATSCTPSSSPWHGWEPAGDLLGDTAFVTSAIRAWDHPSYGNGSGGGARTRPPTFPRGTGRHRGKVHVLYAGRVAFGRLAVLAGDDVYGRARLVVVTDDGNLSHFPLAATNNIAAPDMRHVNAIAIEHAQVVLADANVVQHYYVFVVARVGMRSIRLTSKRIEDTTGLSGPQPGSIPPRDLDVTARTAATAFQRSRPLEATTVPITSFGYTGDVIPHGLEVHATPTAHGDVSPPVLSSSTCTVCQ
ncbi:MAG: hypothetical protein QOK28_2332 [Actinomycetota bacterium]|jgi:hypothetical protein